MASSRKRTYRILDIYPGMEALPILSENLYNILAADTKFPHEISPSMFDYYLATLSLYRLLKLSKFNGGDTSLFDEQLLQNIGMYKLPGLIANYLGGFGDIDCEGLRCKFRLLQRPYKNFPIHGLRSRCSLDGWWGRIDDHTHFLYGMYPSLAVYYSRILEDLHLTLTRSEEQAPWHLCSYIQPHDPAAGYPTLNLLGYKPASRLRSDQVRFLSSFGITKSLFSHHYCYHSVLNYSLITGIYQRLSSYMNLVEVPTTTMGYISQIPYQVAQLQSLTADEPYLYCKFINVQPLALPAANSFQAGAFLYRLKKIVQDSGPNNWCIYDFQKFSKVPVSWQQNINVARSLEDDVLARCRYQSVPYSFTQRLHKCVRRELVKNGV